MTNRNWAQFVYNNFTYVSIVAEGGTQETEMTDNVGEKCCLDDDLILRLAKIAVHVSVVKQTYTII